MSGFKALRLASREIVAISTLPRTSTSTVMVGLYTVGENACISNRKRDSSVEISGKKAIVFGGASGMGRATAEALAERGAVVSRARPPGLGRRRGAPSFGGLFHECDVTDFTGTEQTLAAAVEALGGLHVTVTTAGGGIAKRTLSKSGPHDLESFRGVST